ncbi:unnamed protein product [Effrenium voratum]|nr:unnamed protein product [Effrenium voratum]
MELQPLREEEDDEREPLRGGVPISEEEWRNLDWFIGQSMIRPLRCAELIYLIAVPSIATVGGFFTTQKTGFPVIFYFMYLPLLLGSKILEVYILKGWGDIDCNAASIQRAQWAKIGFRHPVMLLIFGSLEHADLFLDVVFTATAFSSGFVKLGICSILCLVASLAVQYLNSQLSALAMVVSGRDVYIPLVQVWGASCLQGMQWLASTTKAARFGEGELVPDMGLEDARVSAHGRN